VSEQIWFLNPDELKECENKLEVANQRISQLEEQILKAKKQRGIVTKVIEDISQEELSNKKIVALLNQHFWDLV